MSGAPNMSSETNDPVRRLNPRMVDSDWLVMRGMAREIRALPGKPGRIPIVALTANVMPDEIAACRAAGMQAHLAKPIDPGKLMALLEQIGAAVAAS